MMIVGNARTGRADESDQPDPFSQTHNAFVRAWRGRLVGGRPKAVQIYSDLHRNGLVQSGVRVRSGGDLHISLPDVVRTMREESSEGDVVKFLTRVRGTGRLKSGDKGSLDVLNNADAASLEVESVCIPMLARMQHRFYSLCVSSQVGCAMGCTFCETAQMGLIRSLSVREIVHQWFAATHTVGIRPKNIVFMGMGEPMDNLDNVIGAIGVLTDHRGPAVAMSNITVSTVGRVEGIEQLSRHAKQPGWHRLGLAISLNAPNDEIRSSIMPINRASPMMELRRAMVDWPQKGNTKLCIEYVLIPGVNNLRDHAIELAAYLRPLASPRPIVMLNVIPYNPRRNSPWPAPTELETEQFVSWMIDQHIPTRRRRTKGRTLMGACGQLGNEHIRNRTLVGTGI